MIILLSILISFGFSQSTSSEVAQLLKKNERESKDCGSAETEVSKPEFSSNTIEQKVKALNQWPGLPESAIEIYRLILRQKNPPTDFKFDSFMADYNQFSTCGFDRVGRETYSLSLALTNKELPLEDKKKVAQYMKDLLLKISHFPHNLAKTHLSLILLMRLSDSKLDDSLKKKERQIKNLYAKAGIKSEEINYTAKPGSAAELWTQTHQAEALRMELARILYFP